MIHPFTTLLHLDRTFRTIQIVSVQVNVLLDFVTVVQIYLVQSFFITHHRLRRLADAEK